MQRTSWKTVDSRCRVDLRQVWCKRADPARATIGAMSHGAFAAASNAGRRVQPALGASANVRRRRAVRVRGDRDRDPLVIALVAALAQRGDERVNSLTATAARGGRGHADAAAYLRTVARCSPCWWAISR